MLQVSSSDGANENLCFLKILGEKRRDENLATLIDLGTCGLHTVDNAFKLGKVASGCKVKKLILSLDKIFEDIARYFFKL